MGKSSSIDAKVAAELARIYGFSHQAIEAAPSGPDDLAAFNRHTAGASGDAGAALAAGRYHRDFPSGSILLSGGIFETGRRFYADRLTRTDFSLPEQAAKSIADGFREDAPDVLPPLAEWIRYRTASPIIGMDWIDLFYLDQRWGGWGTAQLQESDAYPVEVFLPANSWKCLEILLSVPVDLRKKAMVQTLAIDQLCPGLWTAAPVNPRPLRTRARHAFRHFLAGSALDKPARWLHKRSLGVLALRTPQLL